MNRKSTQSLSWAQRLQLSKLPDEVSVEVQVLQLGECRPFGVDSCQSIVGQIDPHHLFPPPRQQFSHYFEEPLGLPQLVVAEEQGSCTGFHLQSSLELGFFCLFADHLLDDFPAALLELDGADDVEPRLRALSYIFF